MFFVLFTPCKDNPLFMDRVMDRVMDLLTTSQDRYTGFGSGDPAFMSSRNTGTLVLQV